MATKKQAKGTRASKKSTAPARGLASAGQQIWLAGLGALSRAQTEGPKLFESLVEEGKTVHEKHRGNAQHFVKDALQRLREAVASRIEPVREKTTETFENLEQIFQTRVKKALHQLDMPTAEEIHALSRRVSELNRSVQELSRNGATAKKEKTETRTPMEEGTVI